MVVVRSPIFVGLAASWPTNSRIIRRRLAVRVMRNPCAGCRVGRAFPAGGIVAKDEMIGAHKLLGAEPGWCLALPCVGQNRFTMAALLPSAPEPSP